MEGTGLRETLEAFDNELNEIKNVVIRESRNGLRTAIIRAPQKAVRRLIDLKKLKIGWGMYRIK